MNMREGLNTRNTLFHSPENGVIVEFRECSNERFLKYLNYREVDGRQKEKKTERQ